MYLPIQENIEFLFFSLLVQVWKRYESADCNDKSEVSIGRFDSALECGVACRQKVKNAMYMNYGKNSRSKECFCELSKTCSSRKKHPNFDVFLIWDPCMFFQKI